MGVSNLGNGNDDDDAILSIKVFLLCGQRWLRIT